MSITDSRRDAFARLSETGTRYKMDLKLFDDLWKANRDELDIRAHYKSRQMLSANVLLSHCVAIECACRLIYHCSESISGQGVSPK